MCNNWVGQCQTLYCWLLVLGTPCRRPEPPQSVVNVDWLTYLRKERPQQNQQDWSLGGGQRRVMMTRQFQQLILSNDLVLRNIFSFLDPEDIKTAMLVCRWDYVHDKTKHQTDSGNIEIAFRRWKEELEIKEFWNIEVTDDNLNDVMKTNRILLVDMISLD